MSLASADSGIEMRTVPLNCQLLSLKSTPVVTARSAVMRIWPCVIVMAPYSTTPFWLSKFRELAVELDRQLLAVLRRRGCAGGEQGDGGEPTV